MKLTEKIKHLVGKITEAFETPKGRKRILEKIRNISFAAIILVMGFVGLYFLLGLDLSLQSKHWLALKMDIETTPQLEVVSKSKSLCLFISILLTFGSAIVSGFSEIRKDKPVLVYILKGVAAVLTVLFLVYVGTFESNFLIPEFVNRAPLYAEATAKIDAVKLISTILSCVGLGLFAINITTNVILGIEE